MNSTGLVIRVRLWLLYITTSRIRGRHGCFAIAFLECAHVFREAPPVPLPKPLPLVAHTSRPSVKYFSGERLIWTVTRREMTDSKAPEPQRTDTAATIPDPAIVCPTAVNGQCEQADRQQEQPKTGSQGDAFKMDGEMKITDSIEGQGMLWQFSSKFKWASRLGHLSI